MSVDTYIAITSLIFNVLTAGAAIYIAYIALVHTVKPRINVCLREPPIQPCDHLIDLHYELKNRGYWYALPPAIDITVFCDFDPEFGLIELSYGSQQEIVAAEVRIGKGGLKFLKAKGLKLLANDFGEVIQVHLRTPTVPGTYLTRISVYSQMDYLIFKIFPFVPVLKRHPTVQGAFKQTTESFHRILSDDTAKTYGVLPRTIAVALLFDEYRKFQLIR